MLSTHRQTQIDEFTHFPLQKCKFKCTQTDTKHEKALIKRTSQHNIRLWERQYTVSLFSISTSLTLNSRSTVAKKLPKLSFSFAPSKSSPICERRCLLTLTRNFHGDYPWSKFKTIDSIKRLMSSWSRVLNITFLITYLSFSNRTFLNPIFLSIEESKVAWQQQQQESKTGLSALLSGWQPWCLRPKNVFHFSPCFLASLPVEKSLQFISPRSIYHHVHSAVARKPVHGITIFHWT